MSLLQSKQLIWDEVITKMKNKWEYITSMTEKKNIINDYEFFILPAKEEGEKNVQTTKIFIQYVNEKPLNELRVIDVVDWVSAIMEISKVVQKEEAKAKAEECLEIVLKDVATFDSEFEQKD